MLWRKAFKSDAAERRLQMPADVNLVSGIGPGADARFRYFREPLVQKVANRPSSGVRVCSVLQ